MSNYRQTEHQFLSKKEEVISKFKKDFFNNYYNYDPMFHSVAEMLFRDADPYEIIEQLISDIKKIQDELIRLMEEGVRFPQGRKLINIKTSDGAILKNM